MRNLFRYSLFVVFLTFGCDEKKSQVPADLDAFLGAVTNEETLRNARIMIVIPNAGCSGCIMDSEQYMFDNIDRLRNTFFVLTSFNSVKELRAKYFDVEQDFLKRKNIILDINKEFSKLTMDKRYPLVVFLTDGMVNEVKQFDSGNRELMDKIESAQ